MPRWRDRHGSALRHDWHGKDGNATGDGLAQIRKIVYGLPKGWVATYGEIAEAVYGAKDAALGVASAIRKEAGTSDCFPWWRVVDRNLKPAAARTDARKRLEAEGVTFRGNAVHPRHRRPLPRKTPAPAPSGRMRTQD